MDRRTSGFSVLHLWTRPLPCLPQSSLGKGDLPSHSCRASARIHVGRSLCKSLAHPAHRRFPAPGALQGQAALFFPRRQTLPSHLFACPLSPRPLCPHLSLPTALLQAGLRTATVSSSPQLILWIQAQGGLHPLNRHSIAQGGQVRELPYPESHNHTESSGDCTFQERARGSER